MTAQRVPDETLSGMCSYYDVKVSRSGVEEGTYPPTRDRRAARLDGFIIGIDPAAVPRRGE